MHAPRIAAPGVKAGRQPGHVARAGASTRTADGAAIETAPAPRPSFGDIAIFAPSGEPRPRPVSVPTLHRMMAAPAQPLPHRSRMEEAFGSAIDLSAIQVYVGGRAARLAALLHARAFAAGDTLAFAAPPDLASTAHETAHLIQQAYGAVPARLSQPGDAGERAAHDAAARVLARQDVRPALPRVRGRPRAAIQREYSRTAPTGVTDPKSQIPLADFITYIQAVEKAFPRDDAYEILTRVRQMYYRGAGFDELIPDAPMYENFLVGGVLQRRLLDQSIGQDAWQHLTARADENAKGDNPSPYLVLPSGEKVDIGHLFLVMDAFLHPRATSPYTNFGIPNLDPAGWPADLALAVYWTKYHDDNKKAAGDAPIQPATSDFEAYYRASAPESDLLGDADAFGPLLEFAVAGPASKLSDALKAYFLGPSLMPKPAGAGINSRWRNFCIMNDFKYTQTAGKIAWDASIYTKWTPRIDRLCDLFEAGKTGAAKSLIAPIIPGYTYTPPAAKSWPYTRKALDHLLDYIKPKLEAEIAAHP